MGNLAARVDKLESQRGVTEDREIDLSSATAEQLAAVARFSTLPGDARSRINLLSEADLREIADIDESK